MEIKKELTDILNTYVIRIFDETLEFRIFFAGNFDLYWTLYTESNLEKEVLFTISKENYYLYSLFEKLFFNIENAIIYDISLEDLSKYSDEELDEVKDYYNNVNMKLRNSLVHDLLYSDGVIKWVSDFCIRDNCNNEVIIKKEDNRFILKFIFNDIFNRSIRFRNSRSRYDPFNICFMNMFDRLQEYDVDYHQIHMEEYLYKKKVLNR